MTPGSHVIHLGEPMVMPELMITTPLPEESPMKASLFIGIVSFLLGIAADAAFLVRPSNPTLRPSSPPRPSWPGQYQVSWEFSVPYVSSLQSTPLKYKYQAWQDTENGRQKFTRDGVETTIEVLGANGGQSFQYQVYPRIDKLACTTDEIGGGAGPTAQAQRRLLQSNAAAKLGLILPDISEDRWSYNGTATVEGGRHKDKSADTWVWKLKNKSDYGEYDNTYTFYADKDGSPLRLNMWGFNLYTDGHFDLYIADYYDYKEGTINANEFEVPKICPEKPEVPSNAGRFHKHVGGLARMRSLLPNAHYGDEEYDAFAVRHGRRHRSPEEYQARLQVYRDSQQRVQQLNARDDASHQVEANKFADWTQEEFEALVLPNRHSPVEHPTLQSMQQQGASIRLHQPVLTKTMLPSTVDWRGTPADSAVKDQAACGSCWAFGSTASIETAYYLKTGKPLLLSEQNLMDCAWDYGNTGCLGGFQALAYNYMHDKLEIASEESYPYEGVTNYCKKNWGETVKFKKFTQVWVNATKTLTQEEAVMEAIFTKGPMTVSVNAEPEDWRFYKSGVYVNKQCSPKLKKLDHAVIVSGYGQTEEGEKYWIVKNTWSPFWGERGYMRISRDPQYDCGIATQAIYTDIELAE